MTKIITERTELFKVQKIERQLFALDTFSPTLATFPAQVFKKKFDAYRFLNFNDWFANQEDYSCFLGFLRETNQIKFYISCPPHFMVHPVEVMVVEDSHAVFMDGIRHQLPNSHVDNLVGVLVSGQVFMYDDSESWAAVHDITHDFVIIGLNKSLVSLWEKAFFNKTYDASSVIERLNQAFLETKVDDKTVEQIKLNYTDR